MRELHDVIACVHAYSLNSPKTSRQEICDINAQLHLINKIQKSPLNLKLKDQMTELYFSENPGLETLGKQKAKKIIKDFMDLHLKKDTCTCYRCSLGDFK